jgi:hypothetical protein
MKELLAALLLALEKKAVTTDHAGNIKRARGLIGDIRVSNGDSWETLFTAAEVQKVFDGTEPLKVGDTVTETKTSKSGTIKAIGYRVEGLGNKYYSEEELE